MQDRKMPDARASSRSDPEGHCGPEHRSGPERTNDFVVKIATVNGSGSASANSLLFKSIFRMGVPVSAKNIFPSNIQGLPTWYEVRVNGEGHTARSPHIDLAVAMNPHTFADDMAELVPGGYLLYDSTWPVREEQRRKDVTLLPVPLTALSVEAFPDPKIRILMKNITYVGALAALLDIELGVIKKVLEETYERKKDLSAANMQAIELAWRHVKESFDCPLPIRVKRLDRTAGHILISGNTACALGALYAGATVAGWYPITPATSLTDAFRQLCRKYRRDPETGRSLACVVQAEDELAAVGIAVGAGWAGARAFTPTSGPGISLMGEFLGFAYYAEIPLVVFDIQRVGPSTGLPTRTQQGDILACAYASHGDTRHILLFPANPEECFALSVRAFDLAERFQTPVIVLSDLDIGMNEWMCPALKWDDSYRPDRGKVLGPAELEKAGAFYRYLDPDGDGISYRTLPGSHPKGAYFTRGTGHNPYGKYSEKAEDYVENVDRLRRKFRGARAAVPAAVIGGPGGVPFGVVTVGGCDLAVREALERLAGEGLAFDLLRIRAFPFGREVEQFLADHAHVFVVEQNRDAQLRSLLVLETGVAKEKLSSILAYGGMPLDAGTVTEGIRELLARRDIHELDTQTQGPSPSYIAK
jgi:2-oxoglutarate ferredoxin oxidoreductase subunit alpha